MGCSCAHRGPSASRIAQEFEGLRRCSRLTRSQVLAGRRPGAASLPGPSGFSPGAGPLAIRYSRVSKLGSAGMVDATGSAQSAVSRSPAMGRPRDSSRDLAILDATLSLLTEVGYEQLSM